VRIFKNPWFARLASKKDIVNNILETEQADADLGGDVYKVRVARSGEGKYKSELLVVST
jgi:hypothetical protein